ncbi:MAG: hypothetical protein LBM98_00760 [Oscillospiraceae bacterium]|jgi:hypothetical protein|nr:hypothetical protein [Oscillospiraceae bacterium]
MKTAKGSPLADFLKCVGVVIVIAGFFVALIVTYNMMDEYNDYAHYFVLILLSCSVVGLLTYSFGEVVGHLHVIRSDMSAIRETLTAIQHKTNAPQPNTFHPATQDKYGNAEPPSKTE